MLPLRDSHPAGIFPIWVIIIIAVNTFVFYLQLTSTNPEAFAYVYGLVPRMVDFSDYNSLLPFITSQFLHGGFLHIISNMLFLWVFGDNVEAKLGSFLFPFFYIASGIAAGALQFFFSPSSNIPMIGASGAVAGVLGAYLAYFPHHTIKTLVPFFGFISVINVPASFMLIYWFITQLFSGVATIGIQTADTGGIAFFAHIGGFAFGWIIAKILK